MTVSAKPAPSHCPHAPLCIPCPLRGMGYRAQLARKRDRVVAALAAYPGLEGAPVEDVVGSRDLFGYRNVVKLAVRRGRGAALRAGVYAPGSHRLVDAEGCAVQHPAIGEVVRAVLDEASALAIEPYDERDGSGELRYVIARHGAWRRRVHVVLVTAKTEVDRLRALVRRLTRRCRSLGGVVHSYNPERGNVILGKRWATLRPPAEMVERIGFLELRVHPGSFLQANPWTARRIYETVCEWAELGPQSHVLDLFCGVGPLSLYLASRAARVIGVEESPTAIADARANQRRNHFHNVTFREGAVDTVLPDLGGMLGKIGNIGKIDVVTLNPPRKGVSAATCASIAGLAPERVIYVSCDADTLARDLDRLASAGYRTERIRPFDMLPQTEHVEVVALATR